MSGIPPAVEDEVDRIANAISGVEQAVEREKQGENQMPMGMFIEDGFNELRRGANRPEVVMPHTGLQFTGGLAPTGEYRNPAVRPAANWESTIRVPLGMRKRARSPDGAPPLLNADGTPRPPGPPRERKIETLPDGWILHHGMNCFPRHNDSAVWMFTDEDSKSFGAKTLAEAKEMCMKMGAAGFTYGKVDKFVWLLQSFNVERGKPTPKFDLYVKPTNASGVQPLAPVAPQPVNPLLSAVPVTPKEEAAKAWSAAPKAEVMSKAKAMMPRAKAPVRISAPSEAQQRQRMMQEMRRRQAQEEAKRNYARQQEEWLAKKAADDDTVGHFEPELGQVLDGKNKYIVFKKKPLGTGTFSSVYLVSNQDKKLMACKAIRSQEYFRRYAHKEVQIMIRLRDSASKDSEGSANVLMLADHFMQGPHLCMVYQKMGMSLRSFGRQPLVKCIAFSKMLLLALRYLHDSVGMIHCDVKPDNMLVRHDGEAVKLCDFGAAGFTQEKQQVDELQPLFYRAPEVLLGAPRGRKIDIWSSGCTIYELATGKILFRDCQTPRDCVEKILRLRGPLPDDMLQKGRNARYYLSEEDGLGLCFNPEAGGPKPLASFKAKPIYEELAAHADFGADKGLNTKDAAANQLSRLIGSTTVVGAAGKQADKELEAGEKKLEFLSDLIEACLNVDPSVRIGAADAVKATVFKDCHTPEDIPPEDAPAFFIEEEEKPLRLQPKRAAVRTSNTPQVELITEDMIMNSIVDDAVVIPEDLLGKKG